MKRLSSAMLIMIFSLSSVVFAATSHQFQLNHEVAAVSSVAYTVNGDGAVTAKVNKLGDVTISNNTLDGWNLTVLSANQGQFMNTTTANGEVPLGYQLEIEEVSGTLGDGMSFNSVITLGPSASEICGVTTSQNSATVNLKLAFQVDFSAYMTRFDMAGDYEDTLTITYADI